MTEHMTTEDVVNQLAGIPRRIVSATRGKTEVSLHRRTTEEPWSANDVLAHLRAAADNRMRFMRRMASGAATKLAYASPRSELKRTDYADRPFAENLAAFEADRAALVAWLRTLPREALDRAVSIRDRAETVSTYARYLADHELAHCEQIEALVADREGG